MATKKNKPKDDNLDPLSGEPGAHPVGAGVGAAVGAGIGGAALGATAAAAGAATGTAIGAAAGPVGAAVGAIAGGLAGGLFGKSVAEDIDPTAEDAYWRQNFKNRPYYQSGSTYDDYRPAYQHGWEARARYEDSDYDEVEAELEKDWQQRKAKLHWNQAKPAVRDAWERIDNGPSDRRPQKG